VAAVLAAVAFVVVAHPFGHQVRAAERPSSRPTATGTVAGNGAGDSAPASPGPSAPAGSASSPAPASPSGSSPASPTPEQAAAGLAPLLAQSAEDRAAINQAYNDAIVCGPHITQDVQAFESAASSHRELLSELAQLPGRSALSQPMLADLQSAWQDSASADDDYATWAQDGERGCSAGNQSDPSFLAVSETNHQATASKTAFAQLWNPLAEAYGLTTYQQDGF
jgi:eukaryotic-like serine/threonine-protein kinase